MDQMSDSAQDTQTPNTPELLSDEIKYHYVSSPPSSISTNTHDISRARYHMKELETFAVRVEEAAARAFPNRGRSRYAEVLVVLIKWEESDIDAQPEFNALRSMFEICYGFTTDTWSIPSTHSHNKLMLQAVNYIEKHGTEDNLIIIYYGGHAVINNSRQTTWSCTQDISHASVRWSAIQSVFEESKSDVLYLLDCCSAPGAAPSDGPGVIETIAASDFETWAPGPGRHSFTNALLHVLDDWMHRPSFSAAMLHSEILSVLKHEKLKDSHHSDPHKQENKKTPIYILASEDPKSLSIEICRRTTPGNSWAGTLSPGIAEDIYSPENLHGLTPEGKLAVPHVLISISLEENQLVDVEAWHKWIKQFPALAQFALVEGVFASHSTIILLSLPVLIWDMLPENLAVSFVAFVESRNLLSQISEKLGVEVSKQQQPKEFRGRPDSDTLQIPPPLPLIQQIEQALHKQKQQTMKDWETHFQKEKVRLEGKVQDARDDAQKKELEFLQERNTYRELMERDMREVKKESQVIKEESRRAWEELGRYEHEERERTRLLREGQPITIGGIQVIPMGETDEKDDRGRMVGDVAAWVGGVKSETSQTPRGREGSRARGPPDLLHERQYQELEGTHVARPENSTKRPHETHPNHSVGPTSPIHHENGDIHFDVSITRPPPGLVKPKSNASHQKFKDEKSIASFKSIASGVLSPPDSVVASDEIDESTHEEYESALSGGDEDGFGRGDRGSVDFLQEFLDAGDDAPWNLPRQSMIDGDVAFPQDNREKENRLPEKALDPDQITLEPKSYRSQSKHEPIKSKEPEPTALLDWERRGMQQKLAEHALPRPNAETTLEPTSPEPTKVKDVDPFTLQVLEKGIPQEVVERVLPGQVTPPRKSLELASRTDVGPLTLQALKTYEKLQEEMDTHQATRRPERPDRPVEHIPNRLSHITERDGDWEPKTPGKVGSVGSPQSKRRDEKVGDKKALAAVEEAIKKLIIPEMEELKKEPEMTRKNSDGSGRVPWDSDEKSVGRTESVKHGKGKSSTKKAFEAVEDAIKKEAEALKKKEEEEEEMEALRKLRKGQKEKKRKDEEKEKPKRDGDDKDAAKVSSGRDMEPNAPIALEQKHDGKEVLVDGERALSAVDDAIRKLIAPELEGLKRTESHKSHKSHKSAKGQRHEKSKMNESTNQEPLPSRDESPVKEKLEKGHHRQHSAPKIDDAPSKEAKEANSKAQKASHIDQQKEGEVNSNAPLAKQKSDRGLWWMERKPPSHQREEQPREQLPSSSYSQKNKGKAQDVPLDLVPTPPLDLSPEAEDKHEMRILPQEIDHQTWKGFKFANRDVTPSMSSLPTAIPRSSLNNSTLPSSPNNPWSQSEGSFGTIFPPRTSLDYSRDPRMSFDFSRGDSPHSQPSGSSTSNHNVYSQFPPLPEDRERPLSTPTIPTPLARAPSPPYQHSRFNGNHNPNNPYSQFAQFEQSLSTPTLQRVNTGSSYHSLDDTARSIHNVPMTTSAARSIHNVPITTSAARSIHNVPITNHPITSHPLTSHPIPSLAPVFGPSPYNQNQHQHAPISAVDPTSNPKHSFTFTTAPHSSHQSPPFYPAELPAFPHSLPLSRSNSNSNAQPPRHLQEWERGERGRLSTQIPQAAYLTQPLPSPSPSETETLLKKLILPELETLEKGERARREEEERSRREWEREFGIL